MIERLLDEIRAGGTFETRLLAARLATSPEMVEAMLEHLRRLGRLRTYQACSDACGGCRLESACRPERPREDLRLWQG